MNRDLDSILEQSLSQIEAGKARIQSCLVSYPALADELEPLLHAAQALWTAPKRELSPEARARIEARVLGKTSTQPRSRPARKQRAWFHPSWQWAFGTWGAILMLMLLTTASLAYAASDALPCSSLYPVKLATEDTWLWLAPERDKARLHLRFAHRRLYEVEAMLRQGSFEPSALEALTTHTEAAMQAAEALPAEQALPVLADLIGFTPYQKQMLSGLMDDAPSASWAQPETAIQTCGEQARRAQAAIDSRAPPGQEQTPPGQEQTPPGQEQTPPGQEQTPPGQEQTPPGHNKLEKETPGKGKPDKP